MMNSKSVLAFVAALLATNSAVALSSQVAGANPAIKAMANGMSLLKPAFVAEAKIQASLLGGQVDSEEVAQEIASEVQADKIVIYTYGLSPFSTEAVAILEKNGYEYNKIELGAEWFLLGGKNSVKRVLLSEQVDNGATSLPKVFINGQCIGGCAELAEAADSGALETMVNPPVAAKKSLFALF
uniref:Glutaredoxin domain-containing protein n=1 Tax=Entomoneis paludosa TaxID=265537 RepID=A0A7S2YS75_9STRA|mmetsp:Transcript_7464/g.15586  ORF Transcript_7464/g.15586 Transcript_7464/m.15586 type:complete len:184 (+) Transcript_7464:67-618(+)